MKGKYIFALILITIGMGFLLDQFNVISFSRIFTMYWPIILIIMGVTGLFDKRSSRLGNTMLIVLGLIFQIKALDIIDINVFSLILPIMFILLGLNILFSKAKHTDFKEDFKTDFVNDFKKDFKNDFDEDVNDQTRDKSFAQTLKSNKYIDLENNIDIFTFMSGVETHNRSQQFKGGKATAIMGAIEIDLRGASLYNNVGQVEFTSVMGSIEIIVPENWRVEVSGIPLLGSIENKSRYNTDQNSQTLRINAFVLMGSIEIK